METKIEVGGNEKKSVSSLNRELYLAAKEVLEEATISAHIGWHSVSAFIDYLEQNYDIAKKGN